jgi:uncharacterized protein (TIGR01777 family)
MNILISGSSGLIGSRLVSFLTSAGDQVLGLVRSKSKATGNRIFWDPYDSVVEMGRLKGVDAVVHLSGESVAGRWTGEKKKRIYDSRVLTTRYLSRIVTEMAPPPRVLVCASAIGYYGNRGDELLTEESEPGEGFLAGVCREWEEATLPATQSGIRVVNLRIGVILSREGGALREMLFPFRIGTGGIIGSGKQYWSWIAIDDVVGAIRHVLMSELVEGPVNVVAPNPLSNRVFTEILGRVLSRPTFFPLPAFAARVVFGEMANDLLLASARVRPTKLMETRYPFRFPELEPALRHVLNR